MKLSDSFENKAEFVNNEDDLLKFTEFIIDQKDVIFEFQEIIGLDFQKIITEGNLCFARNNDDLQDEFKLVFTPADLLDFFTGVFHYPKSDALKNECLNTSYKGIPFPSDSGSFWQLVGVGRKIRD